ncbi:MAG: glutamine synthetase family protein [Pseudomonadota bacterium]
MTDPSEFIARHPNLERFEVILIDINGIPRGKWLPASGIEKAFKSGVNFPYSVYGNDVWGREAPETGLHISTGDRDGVERPIPSTLSLVPGTDGRAAQALFSMERPDGSPFMADPRQVLKSIVGGFTGKGIKPVVAFELEFYLFEIAEPSAPPKPVFSTYEEPVRQNMYDLGDLDRLAPFLDDLRRGGDELELPLDASVSEASPGQFEVNLSHRADPLRAADDAVLLKRMIVGLARKHGYIASFMAKPVADWPGNGMHIHASMMGKDGNIFANEDGETRLGHAIQGLLATMPDALLLFISSFNGFRRLQPGSYAPTGICWGHDNRSVAIRVPASKPEARRIEHRIAGADANPYLVLAAILAGVEKGLNEAITPPPPVDGSAYDQATTPLTSRFNEAIEAFANSRWAKAAFGELLHRVITEVKRQEDRAFQTAITPLERETFL